MQKILFIDRDGTIIIEPPTDFQVDSLEKLSFLPKAISNLRKIAEESDFELVMVTNQDGLGTDSFPEDTFWLPQNKMMEILEGENMLSAPTDAEENFRAQKLLKNTERLACQAYAYDFEEEEILIISIPKETQLPHLEYLD